MTLAAGVLAAAVTVIVAAIPQARPAARALHLYASFETALALVALLAGFLLATRAARTRAREDVLLAWGFVTLALTTLAFGALPAALGVRDTPFLVWGQAVGAFAGSLPLAYAGLAAPQRTRVPRGAATIALGATATVAAAAVAALIAQPLLPSGLHPAVAPGDARLIDGHPLLLAVHGLTAAAFAMASAGALRRARRVEDRLIGWLAVGAALSAAARLNYLLLPVSSTSWVSTGDLLRLGFHLCVLIGAAQEIRSYQRRLVEAALQRERRRIAREVHDGLAQDLAYISSTAAGFETAAGDELADDLARLRQAAGRAAIESRALLEALVGDDDAPGYEIDLERAAAEVARLHGLELRSAVSPHASIPHPAMEPLRRIVVEAIRNAAQHGNARVVRLAVAADGAALRVSVADDGDGFDTTRVRPGRLGISGMRSRAEEIGGRLLIRSLPGSGTSVEVLIP